jgi:hypothetical protein
MVYHRLTTFLSFLNKKLKRIQVERVFGIISSTYNDTFQSSIDISEKPCEIKASLPGHIMLA